MGVVILPHFTDKDTQYTAVSFSGKKEELHLSISIKIIIKATLKI